MRSAPLVSSGWHRRTNVWPNVTSPARGAERLRGATSFYDKSGPLHRLVRLARPNQNEANLKRTDYERTSDLRHCNSHVDRCSLVSKCKLAIDTGRHHGQKLPRMWVELGNLQVPQNPEGQRPR